MNIDFSNIVGSFKTNADLVSKLLSTVPRDQWLSQPADHSNHPLWILGHITVTRGTALKVLGGTWTARWAALFDRGAKLTEPANYPSIEEIKRAWEEVTPLLMSALAEASPEVLATPARQGIPSFDRMIGGTIAFLGFHETYHVGQLAYLNKWLGGGQIVG
jgi:hypothetical protein